MNFIELIALVLTVGTFTVTVLHFAIDAWYRFEHLKFQTVSG